MAPLDLSTRDIPSDDEVDAILNGTLDGEDIFDTSNIQPQTAPKNQDPAGGAGLGIDEEVQVIRKRQPIPKLDEKRLLSDRGIPKLRKISKERLKFKGKGYEYRDIARMLNMYQLWLDDLYPRAKFADGLAMIEKLGHSKSIKRERKQWIDEGKPKHTTEQEDGDEDAMQIIQTAPEDTGSMAALDSGNTLLTLDDEEAAQNRQPDGTRGTAEVFVDEDPDEDELDALLAESDAPIGSLMTATLPPTTATAETDDPFADDMEAMAEMEGMW